MSFDLPSESIPFRGAELDYKAGVKAALFVLASGALFVVSWLPEKRGVGGFFALWLNRVALGGTFFLTGWYWLSGAVDEDPCGASDKRRTFSGGGSGGAAAYLNLLGDRFLTFSLGRIEFRKELWSEGSPGGRSFDTVGSRCPIGYYLGEACGLDVASATQFLGNLGYVETGV